MADRPVRLRLSRRKGFNLQAHSQAVNGLPAVNVARGPGRKWGNPWKIGMQRCHGSGAEFESEAVPDNATATRFFSDMLRLTKRAYPSNDEIRSELRGKNLACWCKPGEPCHADVLLQLANEATSTTGGE